MIYGHLHTPDVFAALLAHLVWRGRKFADLLKGVAARKGEIQILAEICLRNV